MNVSILVCALLVTLLLPSSDVEADFLYSTNVSTDEFVIVDSDTGNVTVVGPLGFDAISVDLVTIGTRLYASNAVLETRVDLYEIDTATGGTISSVEVLIGASSIGFAEGLAQVGGQLKLAFRDDGTAPFPTRSNALGDLSLTGQLTNIQLAANSGSNDGLDLDALGDDGFSQLYATDSIIFGNPLDTRFMTVSELPLATSTFFTDTSNPVLSTNDLVVDGDLLLAVSVNTVYEMDLLTNSLTGVTLMPTGSYQGVAFAPEPSTPAMLLGSVPLLFWLARRRARRADDQPGGPSPWILHHPRE